MDKAIEEDTYQNGEKKWTTKSGVVNNIQRAEGNGKIYYKMSIDRDYYSMFVNDEETETLLGSISRGDTVNFKYKEKQVGDKTYRNIIDIEVIGKVKNINDFDERRADGYTFGMAMNNAALLLSQIATTKENPEKWLLETIGEPDWKAVEIKLFKNYMEQRKELLDE